MAQNETQTRESQTVIGANPVAYRYMARPGIS